MRSSKRAIWQNRSRACENFSTQTSQISSRLYRDTGTVFRRMSIKSFNPAVKRFSKNARLKDNRRLEEEKETDDAPLASLAPPAKKRFFRAPRLLLIICAVILLATTGSVWLWNKTRVERAAKIDSIAVLPLKSLTEGKNNKAFGLGLTDALITKIGSLRANAVRPLSSTDKFVERKRTRSKSAEN